MISYRVYLTMNIEHNYIRYFDEVIRANLTRHWRSLFYVTTVIIVLSFVQMGGFKMFYIVHTQIHYYTNKQNKQNN